MRSVARNTQKVHFELKVKSHSVRQPERLPDIAFIALLATFKTIFGGKKRFLDIYI